MAWSRDRWWSTCLACTRFWISSSIPTPTLCFFSQLGLLGNSQMESNRDLISGWTHTRLSPPLWDGGSLWTALSHRQRATLAWALVGSMQGSVWKPAGSTLAPEPCPVSPAPAHLLFLGTSPRRCPGRWGSPPPEARLWKYISSFLCALGMDSRSRTSSGDGGSGLEAMAIRVWLVWGSGALHRQGRAKASPALKTREAKFQFRFPRRSLLVLRRAAACLALPSLRAITR